MIKIAARLYPGVGYRQVVLTLPEQLRIPFYNHPNQHDLYSQFMVLAQACLTEVIQGQFKDADYKVALIVFLHTHGRNAVTILICMLFWRREHFILGKKNGKPLNTCRWLPLEDTGRST